MKCKMTWLLLLCGLTVALLFSGCSKKKAPDGAETSADAVETVEDALPSDTPATQPGGQEGETDLAKGDETELTTDGEMETQPIPVEPETAGDDAEPTTKPETDIPEDSEPDETICNHVIGPWQILAAPGCTLDGKLTQSCMLCNTVLAEAAVPATGHVEKILPRVEPTGEADGYTEGKQCSVCGEILVRQEVIPAISGSNHTALPLPATLPTCTQIGLTEGSYCGECGEILVKQEMIPALGHSMITVPAVTPTCTAAGLTVGIACEVCHTVLVEQTEIPALGHIEVVLPAVEPTADVDGWTEGKKCSTCGEVLLPQEVIPAKKHVPLPLAAVAPTCTQIGLTEGAYCTICNEIVLKQETIPALGHQETPVVGIPATCSTTGLTDGTVCSMCGEVVTGQEIIPVLPHTIVTVPAKAPTCTEGGHSEVIYCSVCFLSVVEIQTLDPLGHKEETISAVLPTYTTWGTTEGKRCAVCQVILVAPEPVPPLGDDTSSGNNPSKPGGDPSGDVGTGSEGGWDGTSASYFHGGAGTENNPYLIANGEQLAHLANLINSSSNGQYAEKFFRLAGDIDLGGREWTPIGDGAGENESSERSFRGHFDGNGYTISNFRITAYNGEFVGLFGYVDGGCVENLQINDFVIDVSAGSILCAGGLAGTVQNSRIAECSAEGSVRVVNTMNDAYLYVGGLVGEQKSGEIVSSCADCQVNAHSEQDCVGVWIGGLVACLKADSNGDGAVRDCHTSGRAYATASGNVSYVYAGSICGEISQGIVQNCSSDCFAGENGHFIVCINGKRAK